MKYQWKYTRPIDEKNYRGDFPETWRLDFKKNSYITADVNRFKGLVKISAELFDGTRLQSIISNGTIIREKDLRTGRFRDLEEDFKLLRHELSSLPDSAILRMIGGNYGVMTEFTGKSHVVHTKRSYETVEDVFDALRHIPVRIAKGIRKFFKSLVWLPSFWDIFDTAIVMAAGYAVYLLNFNFLHAGLVASIVSLFTGLTDVAIRKKTPYMMKIIATLIPGIYILYSGYMIH